MSARLSRRMARSTVFVVACFLLLVAGRLALSVARADEPLERIRVSNDRRGFVDAAGRPFVPWGFNYDHDETGRLLEDYWETDWPRVEEDFREMKALGANVVRIHLQFGEFMTAPQTPKRAALDRLERLLDLAEATRLYLDLTGLGCYHRKEVPPWYDALGESERWAAQACFWEAVARRAARPVVFCYDLMNEPVVPGGARRDDWLGPAFAGKHFVQFITLDQRERPRPEIARQWIDQLVTAIRRHDRETLITVGLVPWSLDRPGLTSGFVPERVAERLDFLAVHIYPERGKVNEALATLAGFAVGKPVVIEELFPLRCSAAELGQFIDRSRPHASGWIGFYWGTPPAELRPPKSIAAALTLSWLELFEQKRPRQP